MSAGVAYITHGSWQSRAEQWVMFMVGVYHAMPTAEVLVADVAFCVIDHDLSSPVNGTALWA